jgi:hypothetical protein
MKYTVNTIMFCVKDIYLETVWNITFLFKNLHSLKSLQEKCIIYK